jgi:hypothetical protein
MPRVKAKGDYFRDWEAIIGACTLNADLVPGVEPLRTELEGLLAQARQQKVQQESLEGTRVAATQQLEKMIDDGVEVARKIRAYAVVKLGSDNMQLSQFGVSVRKRAGSRKAKAKGVPATPAPAAKETESRPKGEVNEKPIAG